MTRTTDRVALDQWYAIDRSVDIQGEARLGRLLGQDIVSRRLADGSLGINALGDDGSAAAALPACDRYGHAWTTLGAPAGAVYEMPEADETDRRVVVCGAVVVRTSGLRIVENFLDLAHFPFVHTNILGAEPDTEVARYKAEIRRDVDEVWATDCRFFQQQAAMSATEGMMIDYVYRVPSPFVAVLYKTIPSMPARSDVIALFAQPVEEDLCRVHSLMLLIDDATPLTVLTHFQQTIFLQDRIILENQRPRLLPLGPGREIPTRCDATSIAYRTWLREKGLVYGSAPP
jgi:phenylpropionate dioxygenase-like ring-hydroxylating dioxygenase large terminal subunit